MTKRKSSGFTLIEIAIVRVIIGLMLGGVLKGQELINSAKVKNLAGDFRNIPVFIYGYQDKFKALPGDDSAASTHASASKNGDGKGVLQIEGLFDAASIQKKDLRDADHAPAVDHLGEPGGGVTGPDVPDLF